MQHGWTKIAMMRSIWPALTLLGSTLAGTLAQTTAASEPYIAPNYIIAANTNVTAVTLNITTQDVSRQNDTAPLLYGLMFEDISHSGDGGIYAELLINRAFQGTEVNQNDNPVEPFGPVLTGWHPIGDVALQLDRLHPLSDALPNSMKVTVPANATGEVGFYNTGWWGMDVSPGMYNASFFVNAVNKTYPSLSNMTTFTVSLRSNLTNETFASSQIGPVHVDTFRYSELNTTIYNNVTAPNSNNTFAVTFDGASVAGQTFYFSLLSLFPETFKGRANGLRKDLAQPLNDMKPKFLRCPGGNNIEGESIPQRLKWWETIGPLKDRPGRVGDWGYYNTDGLGLMEYMYWCEDMEMEPILAVYAGYSLDGTSYPEAYMDEVLEEIMNELEFLLGDTSTYWGGKRAEYGHPEPFKINYVEIGNEDMFSCTYVYRFPYLYSALTKAYPNIRFLSTQFNQNTGGGYNSACHQLVEIPEGGATDLHVYQQASWYLDNFAQFDNYKKDNNVTADDFELSLLEYSVFQLDISSGYVNYSDPPELHPHYPHMTYALGEGVYQLSAERNPKQVKAMAYAPGFENRNSFAWTPNMISFAAGSNETVLSASYWQQWLFSHYRGSQSVPIEGVVNPLYYVATVDNSTGSVYVKIINTSNQTVAVTMNFDHEYYQVNGTTLQNDDGAAYNSPDDMNAVKPRVLDASQLPMPNNGTTVTSAGSATSMMTSMTSSQVAGEVPSASASITASIQQAAKAKRWNGFENWTWTVPVFSSTVLQFDP